MKTIEFEYEGKEYSLGFTAGSIKAAERNGINVLEALNCPLTGHIDIFAAAFELNHGNVPYEERESIYKRIDGSDDGDIKIAEELGKMFAEAMNNITHPQGNVKWKVTNK